VATLTVSVSPAAETTNRNVAAGRFAQMLLAAITLPRDVACAIEA
jgi:hypothetical protein